MRRLPINRLAAALVALCCLITPALAHPHILIDAKAALVFDAQGRLSAIRNAWTFDEAFSVWQTQGLDTNNDGVISDAEMQDLADDNMKGLAEYGFYVSAGQGSSNQTFTAAGDQKFDFKNNRSTLTFTLDLDKPVDLKGNLDIAVADPEYYVAITFAGPEDVTLENAPAGCATEMIPGHDMPDDLAAQLYAIPADVMKLPPDLEAKLRGVQGAIRLTCAGGPGSVQPVATTALDAVTQVAQTKPALPFGGPPQEPGFKIDPRGPLGFLVVWQEGFYRGLEGAIGRLKTDGMAFWVLGGLSFLYGVFHAAGPGHGKVVIGSYMLANERQLRRGIVLSFVAAMVQSASAVVFIGIAAIVLGLSSAQIDPTIPWFDTASYALIALLGLWLVIRKVFGLGHSHAHKAPKVDMGAKARAHLHGDEHALAVPAGQRFQFRAPLAAISASSLDAYGRLPGDAHYGHDHGDDHDHDHHDHKHIVTPEEAMGDWREQLGVVLAVGIRPCTGALLVLMFALSQGVFLEGIAAVFLMGVGTAITVAALAIVAVSAKDLARRLTAGSGLPIGPVLWWAELGGALVVLAFGASLFLASLP